MEDIVTSISKMNDGIVTFTAEELRQIYEAAGTAGQDKLRETARQLFPDRLTAEGIPPISSFEGGGRAFRHGGEGYQKPAWTIASKRCPCLGIMADGTAYVY